MAKTDFPKVEIQWLKSQKSGIAQIYNQGLQYAFVSKDNKQCHDLVYCKDFLHDCVQATLHGSTASIHSFQYSPKEQPPIDLETTRIALANQQDKEFRGKIPAILDFVNQVNKELHLKSSVALEASNPLKGYEAGGVFVIEGSARWMNAPPMLSMYTLFLRAAAVHKVGTPWRDTMKLIVSGKTKPYQTNDASWLAEAQEGIDRILRLGYRKIFFIDNGKNYPAGADIDTMHEYGGICAFATGEAKELGVKYWTRKSLDAPPVAATDNPEQPKKGKKTKPVAITTEG